MHSPVRREVSGGSLGRLVVPQALRAAYVGTIFLSALLLFAVQPMLAKMVLPRLGGSPSVWAVSMCFFQGALLLGYTYAFLLTRLAHGKRSLWVHGCLLAAACLALPVGLPKTDLSFLGEATYLWLGLVLAASVGLPFFAVAANAPLLQSWFARSSDPDAQDPYFLYRASNAGSLLGLLAYPVLLEPTLSLTVQAVLWSAG